MRIYTEKICIQTPNIIDGDVHDLYYSCVFYTNALIEVLIMNNELNVLYASSRN